MESLFIKILNLSITGGYMIMAVLIARIFLKKAPGYIRCLLWTLVGLRLIFPFSLESIFSLIPSKQVVGEDILYSSSPSIYSRIPAINSTINPVLEASFSPTKEAVVTPMERLMSIAAYIWIAGMIALILYGAYSYITIKKRVAEAVPLEGNIYYSDAIASPFILGFLVPRIYLPFALNEQNLPYVLAHEKAHLRRKDHLIKPAAYLILTVYWFNPLLWLAYILLARDIELACDERVLKELGNEGKKAYSTALLNCSINRKTIAACPVAFGEVGVKERVKNVLSYKKPSFWIILAAAMISIIVAICFLTSPKDAKSTDGQYLSDVDSSIEGVYSAEDLVYLTPLSSSTPDYFLDDHAKDRFIITKDSFSIDTSLRTGEDTWKGYRINNAQFLKEELADKIYTMGEDFPKSAIDISHYKNAVSYKLLDSSNEDTGYRLYILDGEIWLAYFTLIGGDPDAKTWVCWYAFSLKNLNIELSESIIDLNTPAIWTLDIKSSEYPAFPFRFDFLEKYTHIKASVDRGSLVGFDDPQGQEYPEGKELEVPYGSRLYWKPWEPVNSAMQGTDSKVNQAMITFEVYEESKVLYKGDIIILMDPNEDGAKAQYRAIVPGNSLSINSFSSDGAVIYNEGMYPMAERIITGYSARSYVEAIDHGCTLLEMSKLYYSMLIGDKALKLPGGDFYMVTLEFPEEQEVNLVFFDNDRYGILLPDSNEYLPVINTSKEIYQKFYELYSINQR